MRPELSIVIVNYKNQHLITQCIKSIIEKETKRDFEIIVVDNNSEDNTEELLREIYPKVRWFQMGYNSGFGRANNKGIKEAKGDYILLLNSDIIITQPNSITDSLNKLKQLSKSENIVLGTRLVNPDGSYQETLRLEFPGIKREIRANSFYIFFIERVLKRKYTGKEEQRNAHYVSSYVEYINGAFLLLSRNTLLDNNLFFDEDFFLYGEDIEWAWRARQRNLDFYHFHELELTHIGSASSSVFKSKFQQVMASDWLYIKKTRGVFYAGFTLGVIWCNQMLDSIFYYSGKLRKRQFNSAELLQKERREWTYEILKKYTIIVLFGKNYSDRTTFKINCYDS